MLSKRENEQTKLVPEALCCPLTKRLFKIPVIASNGKTYEKEALLKLYNENDDYILLEEERIANRFFEDRSMQEKVEVFLKENPDYVRPVSEEKRSKFIAALSKSDRHQMHLSVSEEPALILENLYDTKTVFQHLADMGESDSVNKNLCFLLNLAKAIWEQPKWYGFFENHITRQGKSFVIIAALKEHILESNDSHYSGGNTLLHLAAKNGHKRLVKRLIVECDADTTSKNAQGDKVKDVAQPGSGIPQLIKDSTAEKMLRNLLKPKKKKLDSKIALLENKNAALEQELRKAEVRVDNTEKKITSLEEKVKNLEAQNASLKNTLQKAENNVQKIYIAHNSFAKIARDKGLFAVPGHIVSTPKENSADKTTIQIQRKRGQCSSNRNNFSEVDTYVPLFNFSGARYREAYYEFDETSFVAGLSSSEEEESYRKCVIL